MLTAPEAEMLEKLQSVVDDGVGRMLNLLTTSQSETNTEKIHKLITLHRAVSKTMQIWHGLVKKEHFTNLISDWLITSYDPELVADALGIGEDEMTGACQEGSDDEQDGWYVTNEDKWAKIVNEHLQEG